jgi:hypothetical protein
LTLHFEGHALGRLLSGGGHRCLGSFPEFGDLPIVGMEKATWLSPQFESRTLVTGRRVTVQLYVEASIRFIAIDGNRPKCWHDVVEVHFHEAGSGMLLLKAQDFAE